MKLTSGREVPDRFLTDTVEGIVETYASYGFSDWDVAVHDESQSMANFDIEKENYPQLGENIELTTEEAAEIMEIVEPVARQFANELSNRFFELYNAHLDNGNKIWINPKIPRDAIKEAVDGKEHRKRLHPNSTSTR